MGACAVSDVRSPNNIKKFSLTPARGHVSDEIARLRVARLSIASRPGWLRQRRVSDGPFAPLQVCPCPEERGAFSSLSLRDTQAQPGVSRLEEPKVRDAVLFLIRFVSGT